MSDASPLAEHGSTNLSGEDREWLAFELSRAAAKVFPSDERIGKTPQQDFYFRELLEILVDNALKHGESCAGGTYSELWQFTRDRSAEWRAKPNAKRGRSGYRRESIKTLVHEWNAAFGRSVRAAKSVKGYIQFALDTPGAQSDDVVLRAVVVRLTFAHEGEFTYTSKELTPAMRLRGEAVDESGEDADEKRRLLSEARKYTRRVEAQYLAKLSNAPLEFVQQEVAELKRARQNYRRLAAAVLVVVGTGMAAYKIFFARQPVAPLFPMTGACSGCPSNIAVNKQDRIALKSSAGQQLTEWADAIVGPDGSGVEVTGKRPDGRLDMRFIVPPKGEFGTYVVPKAWHERPEVVLPRRISCMSGYPPHGFMCFVLIDLRSFGHDANVDTVAVGKFFGESPDILETSITRINDMTTRVAIWLTHSYKADGRYETWLIASSDAELRQQLKQREQPRVKRRPSDEKWLHIASVLVRSGEVVDMKTDESSPVQ